jgi:oligoendopeptidase F
MSFTLPKTTEELLLWNWSKIDPILQSLLAKKMSVNNVNEWVEDWSDLNRVVNEIYNRLYVDLTAHTADKDIEQRFNTFLDTVYPKFLDADQQLKIKILASGLEPENFEMPLKKARAESALFRSENIPLLTEEEKLNQEYNRIISAQSVVWKGKEVTTTELKKVYQDTNRARREEAWRLTASRQLADRQAINGLWQKLLDLRLKLAANAGFPDYRSYRWQQLQRFDYTPEDCKRFGNAIEKVVVPAAQRIYARRQKRLGLDSVRPWDLMVDPSGEPPLKPFSTVVELINKCSTIFQHVNPQFGIYFDTLKKEGLLDLDNRKNKAPGAYCASFPYARRPFIFGNSVGLHDDVQTLLHESGHAFHYLESSRSLNFQQSSVPTEFAEVASMGMELLASPYLNTQQGGFYSTPDANRAVLEHLEGLITFWPYMAVVDAFQHWVYENPEKAKDSSECDTCWEREWDRFMSGQDWTGLEAEKKTGWHRKLHIHTVPFYYIEYGVAQLGAVQVWRNALINQEEAVFKYRQALSLGGTVSLPRLFQTAGAQFSFDADLLGEAVILIEEQINQFEKSNE